MIIVTIIVIVMIAVWMYWTWRVSVQNTIRRLFHRLVVRLERANIQYWTDYGTLLGIFRGKDVILGDNDADICIVPDEDNLARCQVVVDEMGGKRLDWGAFRVYDRGVFVDMYIPKVEDSQYCVMGYCKIPPDLIHPIQHSIIDLGDFTFVASLPHRPLDVLQHRYGANWRQPSRNWWTLYLDFEKEVKPFCRGLVQSK